MKVLFFPWRPQINASSRYRIYQYLDYLEQSGIEAKVCPPTSEKLFVHLYKSNNIFKKGMYLFLWCANRCYQVLWCARGFPVVFIQRELFTVGPPIFEQLLRLMGKIIIYDFDDAIFLKPPYVKSRISARLHYYGKVKQIIKISKLVIVGNDFLRDYALRYNSNVCVIPTVPNTNSIDKRLPERKDKVVLGWIGTAGNLVNLRSIEEVLVELTAKHPEIEMLVISDGEYKHPDMRISNREWRLESENQDLHDLDIGLMPILDTDYSRGKCGFKLLQYMAAGLPVICSSLGVNRKIIQDGVNGFLASNNKEWVDKLSLLIKDEGLRNRLGENGRRTVIEHYSFGANAEKLVASLKSCGDN